MLIAESERCSYQLQGFTDALSLSMNIVPVYLMFERPKSLS